VCFDIRLPTQRCVGLNICLFGRRIEIDAWTSAVRLRNGDSISELKAQNAALLAEHQSLRRPFSEYELKTDTMIRREGSRRSSQLRDWLAGCLGRTFEKRQS
jgi:hypothetical protein